MNGINRVDEVERLIRDLGLPNRLMNEAEVAKKIGCAVQTLRNNRHMGIGIRYSKVGRSVKYSPRDIAEHVLQNRIDTQAYS